ncbi:MAG: efflux RND transporter periplasmic adaptor subunit [Kiritimatiellae bacterium]|nr:efflux RND transporter periplasmic adaptor subunit [Kiritimatiellia bacterium]
MTMKKSAIAMSAALAAALVWAASAVAQDGPAAADGAAQQPQGPKPSMFLVGVAKAGTVDHNPVRTFSGRVLSPETVAVVAQVAGEVKKVNFEEGALLKKGAVMYKIDPVKYEAAVASAKAQVAQAAASADYARKSFDRAQALFDKKVASPDDLDAATSAKAQAEATLAAAEAALVTAEDNLAHCTIKAPVDGKVGLNAAAAGNYVSTASGALATIVRQDPVRVAFAPGSRDYLAVFGGEKGLKELFAVGVRLADGTLLEGGEIEFAGNEVNASTDTMPVYARFANPDGLLVPGATVKVEVQAREPRRYVSLPVTAVQRDGDQAFVWMVGENNLPVRRDIEAGPATATYQTVLSGLEAGEEVIVRGTHKVMPGVPVEPVEL